MRTITVLSDSWQFAWLEHPISLPTTELPQFSEVNLPHVSNLEEPAREGCCLYEKKLSLELKAGQRCYLAFDGVGGVCQVALNGKLLGEHRGGYSRFCFDATAMVQQGENLLQVTSDNTRYADVNPLMGDFSYFGGIYRPVTLMIAQSTCFDPSWYGTCGLSVDAMPNGSVKLGARIVNPQGAELRYLLSDANGVHAELTVPAEHADGVLTVENPHFWDGLKDPWLYTCTAQLLKENVIVDEVSLPFGFRSLRLDAEKGFFLNDTPMRINGVAKHQDFEGFGPAPGAVQLEKDFQLIREIGANAVRLSHYQHPQAAYDICDREGFVVWAEIPMLSMPENNEAVIQNAELQLRELILQNKHHPSICFWGVQNEIAMMGEHLGMYQGVKRLNNLVKALDDSRISTAANLFSVSNNSQLNFLTDAVGYNIYFGWYYGEMKDYASFLEKFHKDNPGVPLCISEYGVDCNLAYHTDKPECRDYTEEFQSLFHERAYGAMQADSALWGSFVWNMFDFGSAIRDEGGIKGRNCKGLVTYDRQTRKDAFYYYKSIWNPEPMLHIAGKRYVNRSTEHTTLKVYSNQNTVSLTVGGQTIPGTSDGTVFTFRNIPLEMGENTFTVSANGLTDVITICRTEEPDKSYVYPKKGQSNKVANWFKQQEATENLFPEGRYSVTDRMGDLMANEQVLALLEAEIPDIMSNPRAKMMGGMTLMRVLDYNADTVSQEQVLNLNRMLGRIEKP